MRFSSVATLPSCLQGSQACTEATVCMSAVCRLPVSANSTRACGFMLHVHVYTSVYIELFEKYSRHYKYTAEKVQLFFLLPNPGTLAFIFASREGKPGSVDGDQ